MLMMGSAEQAQADNRQVLAILTKRSHAYEGQG